MKKHYLLAICLLLSALMLFYELASVRNRSTARINDGLALLKEDKSENTRVSEQENDEDADFVEMMKRRMKERRKHVQETCRKIGHSSDAAKDRIELITAEKYRLVYCPVAKTGCSNMKRVMLGLNGYGNDTESIFPKNVAGQTNLLHRTVAENFMIRSNGFPDFVEQKNYVRFIVVRHPFERALSAYKNKLTLQWKGQPPQFEKKAKLIREKYGTEERKNATGKVPLFSEFVDYLYEWNNTNDNGEDNHWNSVDVICHPCQNEFDVIAKIETIEEDLRYLLQIIGAPSSLGMPKGYSKSGKSGTNIAVDPSFKKLGEERMNKLYQVYKSDFEMFHYEK